MDNDKEEKEPIFTKPNATTHIDNITDGVLSLRTAVSTLNQINNWVYSMQQNKIADIDNCTELILNKLGILEMKVNALRRFFGLPIIRR